MHFKSRILKLKHIIGKVYQLFIDFKVSLYVRISPEYATRYLYKRTFGVPINLEKPENFNEKIQWLKLYFNKDLAVQCADKYEVRSYVINSKCDSILNDLLGVYKNTKDIPWSKLPQKYVLKTTNSCDTTIIVKDTSKIDIKKISRKLNNWMNQDYGLKFAEVHYSDMKPKIICEKFIETKSGDLPNDYKFFCFNGVPKYLYVGIVDDTGYTHKTFYDMNWVKQDFLKSGLKNYDYKKPSSFEAMKVYATILSKPFPFVRVDLYDVEGNVIFGELTFTPTGGLATYYNEETLNMLGDLITLPKSKNK